MKPQPFVLSSDSGSNRNFSSPDSKQIIVVTATFTAEPVEKPLQFLLGELETPMNIHFAPYSQVFQQLLDPTSMMAQNLGGLNLVLIRLEDWIPESAELEVIHRSMHRAVDDLKEALQSAAGRSPAPTLIIFCPASPEWLSLPGAPQGFSRLEMLNKFEGDAAIMFESISGVYAVTSSSLLEMYPVKKYDDPYRTQIGRIPYTEAFFAALASMAVRKLYSIRKHTYKVIVLDCDNTLWQGVVGEEGPQAVKISEPYQALQDFMLAQNKAGMVLCLNSKNREEDVFSVFNHRPEMKLKRQDLVSWRINWLPKSENLRDLADELNLSLASFIFVDDNPLECAEVQAACPQVLIVQIPSQPEKIPAFLHHHWIFDHLKITNEDQKRTLLYQQNMQRERLRQTSATYANFVASLDLEIEIQPLVDAQFARAAQLSQRTTQFNATNARRTESEFQCLLQCSQVQVLIVKVRDRFGDYGLVGLLIYEFTPEGLMVDSFLLSCRTLGRGVEHRMLAELSSIALENRLPAVIIPYIPTERNTPILNFLNQVGMQFKSSVLDGALYRFPAQYAADLAFRPGDTQPVLPAESLGEVKDTTKLASKQVDAPTISSLLGRIASEFQDAQHIANLASARTIRNRSTFDLLYTAPVGETEVQLAPLWAEAIELDRVGRHDNFFEFGGNSLRAALLVSRLRDEFKLALPLESIFDTPTVAEMGQFIDIIRRSNQKSAMTRDGVRLSLSDAYQTQNLPDPSQRIINPESQIPLEEGEI